MKNIIKSMLIIASLCICVTVNAQTKHEFSFFFNSGLSALKYNVTVGEQKNSLSGQSGFGYGYQFFFSPNFGLGTSVEFISYNSTFKLNSLHTRYNTADMNSDVFEFRSTVNNYEEKQTLTLLQIPLMLQFQTNGKHKFYISAGGKIGIPINGQYESTNASVVNTGYYNYEDYEYTTQEFMGFGTFTNKNGRGKLDFKTAFFASAEIGMKWRLYDKLSLYTGAYLDYGLSNIYKVKKTQNPLYHEDFVAYNRINPRNFAVNSIFNSQYTQNGVSQSFTDKITPITMGIKLKLGLGI